MEPLSRELLLKIVEMPPLGVTHISAAIHALSSRRKSKANNHRTTVVTHQYITHQISKPEDPRIHLQFEKKNVVSDFGISAN